MRYAPYVATFGGYADAAVLVSLAADAETTEPWPLDAMRARILAGPPRYR